MPFFNGWQRVIDSTTSKLAVVSEGQKKFEVGSVALDQVGANTAALLHGIGTTTTRARTATANLNFMGYWVDSTATSGDCRGLYLRLYISGAGGSGEAARLYTTVNEVAAAVGGTVNGAHISLSITANGSVSGAGNALRATLDFAAAANPGGTLAVAQLDSNFGAAATVPATAAFLRVNDTGSVTLPRLLNVPNVASGGLLAAHTTQGLTHSIRIVSADGTLYYIMVTDAATNRTGGA